LGRAYVKLPKDQPLDYDQWAYGIRDGRSYCSDGLSHLFDFSVNGLGVGEPGDQGRASFLAAKAGEALKVRVKAAALLGEQPLQVPRNQRRSDRRATPAEKAAETAFEEIRSRPLSEQPYWHVERARVGDSRQVPVELVVNGQPVVTKLIEADGRVTELEFDYTPDRSSWVAVRIFPAAHTNPVFVEVDGQPIRASKSSAQWCLKAVDQCWSQKIKGIRPAEQAEAKAAYDVARQAYARILAEAKE
jgi:hypothetical protein